ncbi:MAG: winged helix-turn-helix transcriptional regulator, partial [Aggregatilineales bacterium]
MSASINYWHRQVYIYQKGWVTLADVVRQWAFNSIIGLLDAEKRSFVGYGLDNSPIYDSLIVGVLQTKRNFSQPEIAKITGSSPKTVWLSLKRLEEAGFVEKKHQRYRLIKPLRDMPIWITEFTKAAVELYEDAELAEAVHEDMSKYRLVQGWKAIAEELKSKLFSYRTPTHLIEPDA